MYQLTFFRLNKPPVKIGRVHGETVPDWSALAQCLPPNYRHMAEGRPRWQSLPELPNFYAKLYTKTGRYVGYVEAAKLETLHGFL